MNQQHLFGYAFSVIALAGWGSLCYHMWGLLKAKQATSNYFFQKIMEMPPPPPPIGKEGREEWQRQWDAYKAKYPV